MIVAGAAEPIRQVRRLPDLPTWVVSRRISLLSSSSFYKVEKVLACLARCRFELWSERLLYARTHCGHAQCGKRCPGCVITMNIIKIANFRGALRAPFSFAYSMTNCFRLPCHLPVTVCYLPVTYLLPTCYLLPVEESMNAITPVTPVVTPVWLFEIDWKKHECYNT